MINIYENQHEVNNNQPFHQHGHYQFLFIIEGEGDLRLQTETHLVRQADLMFFPPHSPHRLSSDSKMTVLCLDFESCEKMGAFQSLLDNPAFEQSCLLQSTVLKSTNIVSDLQTLMNLSTNKQAYQEERKALVLSNLLLQLIDLAQLPTFHSPGEMRAHKVKNYIDQHYYQMDNMDQLAKKFNLSEKSLRIVFKETFQKIPLQYLTECRIEKSKQLLANTDNAIATICFEVGYQSLSTFYRQFKKLTYTSPNEYRKTISKNENSYSI